VPSAEQVDNRRRGRGEDRIPQSEGHASSEYARRLEEPTYGVLPSQDRRPQMLSRKTRYRPQAEVPWPIVVNRMDTQ
jgi:hypothetical protein